MTPTPKVSLLQKFKNLFKKKVVLDPNPIEHGTLVDVKKK